MHFRSQTRAEPTRTKATDPAARRGARPAALEAAGGLAARLCRLQSTIGNRAVGRWLAGGGLVQAKLALGAPDDAYEREADREARRVVDALHARRKEAEGRPADLVQRREEEEETPLARKPDLRRAEAGEAPQVSPGVEAAIGSARGAGRSLAADVRGPLEEAVGADLGRVRIHTDARADRLNRDLRARAFTTGSDIFFRRGEFRPRSRPGEELLVHELTHVFQQTGAGPPRSVRRAPGGELVQRTIYGDKQAALADLHEIHEYQGDVFGGIESYIENKIADEEEGGGSDMDALMARGAKAWASNFNAKAGGYLFEAQKVLNHHNPGQGSYAVLGASVEYDPDVEVIRVPWAKQHKPSEWKRMAKEMKSSNSSDHSYFQTEMVKKGFKQLGKRNTDMQEEAYTDWQLDLWIGNSQNIWPYHENEVNRPAFGNPTLKPFQPSLEERIKTRVSNYTLNDRYVRVHLEHPVWGNTTVEV